MNDHFVYVIYKDGQPMDSRQSGLKRNAYIRAGEAKGVITGLCSEELRRRGIYEWPDREKYDELMAKEREHYQVMTYASTGAAVD